MLLGVVFFGIVLLGIILLRIVLFGLFLFVILLLLDYFFRSCAGLADIILRLSRLGVLGRLCRLS